MAREFAKKLYRSKEWIKCRDYIFKKQNGMCEICDRPGEEVHHKTFLTPYNINDPEITLGEKNLQLLCKNCHFDKHRKTNPLIDNRISKSITNNGTYFDEEGNLRESKVYIVYGSPGSGKSTYVRNNRKHGDLIIDLDLIKQSISMEGKTNAPDNLLDVAFKIRDYLYVLIENKQYDCKSVWVIGSLPKKKYREQLAERLGAELIFINASIYECIDRANNDDERSNKELQKKLIEKWFANYEG